MIDSIATRIAEKTITMQEDRILRLFEEKLKVMQEGGSSFTPLR